MEDDVHNYRTVCSTCLSSDRDLISIMGMPNVYQMFRLLMQDYPAEQFVDPMNDTDMMLCWECLALLKKLGRFKKQVHNAQEHLRILAMSEGQEVNIQCIRDPAIYDQVSSEPRLENIDNNSNNYEDLPDICQSGLELQLRSIEPQSAQTETAMAPDKDMAGQKDNAPSVKRKKGQGPMQRKLRKQRSECRKKGEEYTTAKGKFIPAKKPPTLPKNCRAKCNEKTKSVDLVNIFKSYRDLPNRDAQKRYLAGLITIKPKERSRKTVNTKNREVSAFYKLDQIGENICKNCFVAVFGESRGLIDDIVKRKKNSTASIIQNTDLRTVRRSPGNKRKAEDVDFAKEFIKSVSPYESHKSKSCIEKRMNLKLLYLLYKQKLDTTKSDSKPLSLTLFRNVFQSLNLKFKKTSLDTSCKMCDDFEIKIKFCNSDFERQKLEIDKREHQAKAKCRQSKKSNKIQSNKSLNSSSRAVVAAQKCLPHACDPQQSLPTAFDPQKSLPTAFDPQKSLPTAFDPQKCFYDPQKCYPKWH